MHTVQALHAGEYEKTCKNISLGLDAPTGHA